MTITRIILSITICCASAFTMAAAPSILDIKHSITDDNIVPPESFETKTREMQENFYLKKYTAQSRNDGEVRLGNDKEYEELLSRLPSVIEMPYNPIVGRFIELYIGKRRGMVADLLALHNYYGKIFIEELSKEKMPLELQYLPVIESALNPNAVSRAGAAGLWQFMPSTAVGLGMEVNSLVDQRRDPRLSSRAAARYLKQLYEIYGDWSLAIAAYNCGPGNVNKALRRAGGGKKDFWEIYNYLPQETRGYVPAFIAANFVMNYYNRYGINPTVVKHQLVTDTVDVSQRVHFNQISEVLNIPVEEIRMLNPQFRKDIIPGNNHPYSLVLPSQQCLSYIMSEDAILAHDAELYATRTYVEPGQTSQELPGDNGKANAISAQEQTQNAGANVAIASAITGKSIEKTHVVGRGENLRDIARKYGVSATDIKRWNKLRRGKVKEGDHLTIHIVERTVAGASTTPATESTITVEDRQSASTVASKQRDKASTGKATSTTREKKTTPKQPATISHKVKSGESLDKIARRYGVTVAAIQQANGMSKGTTRINIGQTLKIPTKGSASTQTKKSGTTKKKSSGTAKKKRSTSKKRK